MRASASWTRSTSDGTTWSSRDHSPPACRCSKWTRRHSALVWSPTRVPTCCKCIRRTPATRLILVTVAIAIATRSTAFSLRQSRHSAKCYGQRSHISSALSFLSLHSGLFALHATPIRFHLRLRIALISFFHSHSFLMCHTVNKDFIESK